MKTRLIFLLFGLLLGLTSCDPEIDDFEVLGLQPIYFDADDVSGIRSSEPREFENLGNIVLVGNYLFIGERYEGIHVLDNSNPSNPVNILFWEIPGNNEFTIDGTTLYADNSIHLLVIDISDFGDISYIKRFDDFYISNLSEPLRPAPSYVGPFECYDPDKGALRGWQEASLIGAECEAY